LQRNSADLGADVAALSEDIRTMQGLASEASQIAEEVRADVTRMQAEQAAERTAVEERLILLEERLAKLEVQAAKPPSPDELYSQGRAAFERGDYGGAQTLLRQLVTQYPSDTRADDAQYYRGEAYYREQDYGAAIREFQKVFDKYEDSSLADDALFRAGEAAQTLRRCSEARAYFGVLRQKYPRSNLVNKSKSKDQELKRDLKDPEKCSS